MARTRCNRYIITIRLKVEHLTIFDHFSFLREVFINISVFE